MTLIPDDVFVLPSRSDKNVRGVLREPGLTIPTRDVSIASVIPRDPCRSNVIWIQVPVVALKVRRF